MAFPESWLNELMSKNDIASVIAEYVQLTPKGSRLWGHCPFHVDKTPSFSVSPDKQLFHCFSCHAGGSVIQFIMQAENLSYIDAVRQLAQRAGMDMPNEIDDRKLLDQKRRRERIYEANREAAVYYNKLLFSPLGAEAQKYLEKRGVSAETAKRFGLGYSPNGFDELSDHLLEKGFSREIILESGLAVSGKKDPSKIFDFFRGRLMFPVISAAGKVIAFGGRTMGSDEPKYINTGDTPVYNKRENIYAINLLKGKKLDDIIMVEGYMDVISLHQAGIDNAVASLGTALTIQQARLIKRYAPKVFYAYDGDEAGQKAMVRGIDILRSSEIEPRVIVIPGGMDPDEYVKAYGPDSFLSLKDASITGIRFKLERIARIHGTDTPDGREKFAREACSLLASLDPVERDRYIPFVSEKSGVSFETVREQCGVSVKAPDSDRQQVKYNYKRPKSDPETVKSEQRLLGCIMSSRDNGIEIGKNKDFSLSLFTVDALRAFAARLLAAYRTGGKPDISVMIAELEPDAAESVSGAFALSEDIPRPVVYAADLMKNMALAALKDKLTELSRRAKENISAEEKAAVLKEYAEKYAEYRTRSGS